MGKQITNEREKMLKEFNIEGDKEKVRTPSSLQKSSARVPRNLMLLDSSEYRPKIT